MLKSELERQENKDKTGVFIGSYAINPINKDEVRDMKLNEILGVNEFIQEYGTIGKVFNFEKNTPKLNGFQGNLVNNNYDWDDLFSDL